MDKIYNDFVKRNSKLRILFLLRKGPSECGEQNHLMMSLSLSRLPICLSARRPLSSSSLAMDGVSLSQFLVIPLCPPTAPEPKYFKDNNIEEPTWDDKLLPAIASAEGLF